MRCGCSERDGGTTVLEPQQLFFRKSCKTNGLSNILRRRRGALGQQTFTNPLNRQNPYSQRPVWGKRAKRAKDHFGIILKLF